MDDEAEVMWRLYAENTAHGRHHETMRASVTTIVLVIAGAVLTAIGFSKNGIQREHWPLTAFLFFVGLFGALFVVKHYERYCSHMQRARQYRNKLESFVPKSNILQLKDAADALHKAEFRRLADWKLSKFWVALHLLVAIFGAVLTFIALTHRAPPN